MRGRWLVNLGLLILVVVLGVAAQQELERPGQGPTLTDLNPGDIAEVVIERPGAPRLRLARGDHGWRLLEPIAADADAERVARLLRIAAAPVRRSLPGGAELGALGLDPPRVTLRLDALELRVGDTEPLAQRRYVAVGDRIYLIDDLYYQHLTAPPDGWVRARGQGE